MFVLGIESTCDETGCAVVESGRIIHSNVVSSQIDLHAAYGGVVPELACRRHIDVIIPVLDEALHNAKISLSAIDLIAVAHGPGLIGALMIGLHTAKGLALALNKPLIGVNHIEAHLYAALMDLPSDATFPLLGVVVSGGHTSLIKMHSIGSYSLIGQTVDDAVGEAFDKVAKMLGLPYPGGPAIEALAKGGDPNRFPFRAGVVKGRPFDFSYSGLKTRVLYEIKGQNSDKNAPVVIQNSDIPDIAASFQAAALGDVLEKSLKACSAYGCNGTVLGGGVTNNKYLRSLFQAADLGVPIYWPAPELSLDNAAMIAGLGHARYLARGCGDGMDLSPQTRIPLGS
ncbi:MAG: tRNA (adenosine(37)-N6)-threonylcarbamoyltransferase complex transferase subunit TsaD, partial [Chlamydiia bacterium]|nr:tRNA (adenosine(37)-N6)-threonylcarbamoyltransferase complex transferase subunit TsaD [Chlamydiia bacterium]